MSSRINRVIGLASLGLVVWLAPLDSARAAPHCAPGTLSASGDSCDCPKGYTSTRGSNAGCVAIGPPPCGTGPGQKPCGGSPAAGACTLPGDNGATVKVAPGTFTAGSASLVGAGPPHTVTLTTEYQIDKYEVSVADYEKCVKAGVCAAPPTGLVGVVINAHRCNYGTKNTCYPMNCVTYLEATTYCQWKGKRLPTEAEWEYAARGKASNEYPWGAATPTCDHANFSLTPSMPTAGCGDGTSPIGRHPKGKSPFHVEDMEGNVEEWVWDWFERYNGVNGRDPGGPLTGTLRATKGSAWDQSTVTDLAAARREGVAPTQREVWLGFRCAMGASPSATPAMYATASAAVTTPTPIGTWPTTTTTPTPQTAGPSDLGAMIKIPGGIFKMGSSSVKESAPERMVTLSAYQIDKYEVTVSQYKQCVTAGSCLTPVNTISAAYCQYGKIGQENHPVSCVEWSDARKYCAWAGKRLPTEAEWEFAARGLDGRTYPWGYSLPSCDLAAFKPDSGAFCTGGGTSVVGTHPLGISYWGLHDMSGNTEEWIFDYYAPYSSGPLVNPSGPMNGKEGHVVRGGNWEIGQAEMRTYSRYHFDSAKYWIGFRCAKTGN